MNVFPADYYHCALTHLKSPNVFFSSVPPFCAFPPWLHTVFSRGSTSFNIYSLLINTDLEKGEVQSWTPPREVTRSLPQWLLSPGPWCYWHHCLSPLYCRPKLTKWMFRLPLEVGRTQAAVALVYSPWPQPHHTTGTSLPFQRRERGKYLWSMTQCDTFIPYNR